MNTSNSEIQKPAASRRHSRYRIEFKRQVIAACHAPGVSKAAIPLANRRPSTVKPKLKATKCAPNIQMKTSAHWSKSDGRGAADNGCPLCRFER